MTPQKKLRIKERDGFRCTKCYSREQLTIDHIIPQSEGGTNDDDNLTTLCKGCNVMKSNKPPKYRSIFNLFFSRKTIYEFKNEFKTSLAVGDGLTLAKAQEIIDQQRKEIDELFTTVERQQSLHTDRIHKLAERIRGLQTFHKIEWAEETISHDLFESTVTIKAYRKIPKQLTSK